MPKNKFQDVVFTIIMATIMVYGMVVYNIALNTGTVDGTTFIAALHELPIMVPVAFILEFFIVGRLARLLAFTVMKPTDRPQFITYAISICICCIMCPVMSLVAIILFKEPSFGMWVKTWAMNFPMAILYQMFYCGPFVRLIFRAIFERKDSRQKEAQQAQEA
jgi:hypothetical protein